MKSQMFSRSGCRWISNKNIYVGAASAVINILIGPGRSRTSPARGLPSVACAPRHKVILTKKALLHEQNFLENLAVVFAEFFEIADRRTFIDFVN